MKTIIITTASILFMTASIVSAQTAPPPHVVERTLELNAENLGHLVSRHGRGLIRVQGESGRTDIEVRARVHYYVEEDIQLSLTAHNDRAEIDASFAGGQYSGKPPYIDLTVLIPNRFSAELISEAGNIEVSNLQGMAAVDSAAANIFVENTGGTRVINGSEGTVRTRDIHGPVRISQRSAKR